MSSPDLSHRMEDPNFTTAHFDAVAKIALQRFGLSLTLPKKTLVQSRLKKRMNAIGTDDFGTYIDLFKTPGSAEEDHLLSALTTNVTHFFREAHHFDQLRNDILPALLTKAKTGKKVRLWSAACSSGQEAYSIAATLLESVPDLAKLDIKVLATDIDPKIIELAKTGTYRKDEASGLPDTILSKYFDQSAPGEVSASSDLRQLITFGQLNLIAEWPMNGPFDVIFCRNVAIYFDKPTQARLWRRFHGIMNDGGHLMIGHSERIDGEASGLFSPAGVTAYRK